MQKWLKSHKVLAILLGVVLVLVGVLLIWVETSRAPAPLQSAPPAGNFPEGAQMTIEGEVVCLPHKDTSGPQTLECAYGIQVEGGTYYGLKDSDASYRNIAALPVGKKAKLSGTLQVEPSDRYQSVGTFTVSEVLNIE